MKKAKLVQIEWRDSQNWSGWRLLQDVVEEYEKNGLNKQLTVGYVVEDNKERITVAQSLSVHPVDGKIYRGADFMTIPKGCVINIKRIKE